MFWGSIIGPEAGPHEQQWQQATKPAEIQQNHIKKSLEFVHGVGFAHGVWAQKSIDIFMISTN